MSLSVRYLIGQPDNQADLVRRLWRRYRSDCHASSSPQ